MATASYRVSPYERDYVTNGIQHGIREDGRGRSDYRPLFVETSVMSNTNGSARVRLSGTEVLAAVKCEIGEPSIEKPNNGRVIFTVDCAASASPEFERRGANAVNIELSEMLTRMEGGRVGNDDKLCIVTSQQVWIIYVDVTVVVAEGNLHDAVSVAVRAAMSNTRIPKINVISDGHNGPVEIEVSDNPHDYTCLTTEAMPVAVTLSQIGDYHIVDATLHEETCMASQVIVGINGAGNVGLVQKRGSVTVEPTMLFSMIESGYAVGMDLISKLDALIALEATMPTTSKRGFLN